eukprot:gnl/Spiro4/7104_TR3696_c0_g1_i2.p5 gnl/Spiro4/7104_TR3696_c0_g1~~gnl/Spiro4/7104_TR3696_c0_g1_i2.p5  ORF type:complete len:116 (+),score=8.03 gnl/Spiro4/7104_TR3696_c0_g1_i2:449-796(+)
MIRLVLGERDDLVQQKFVGRFVREVHAVENREKQLLHLTEPPYFTRHFIDTGVFARTHLCGCKRKFIGSDGSCVDAQCAFSAMDRGQISGREGVVVQKLFKVFFPAVDALQSSPL